jgi:hypothetical protein
MKWDPHNTLVVDANLLVLIVVGSLAPERIERFARTKKYTGDDFNLAREFIARFRWTVTTPHILSQVSDLLQFQRVHGDLGAAIIATLRHIYATTHELQVPARNLAREPSYPEIGLADCSIMDAASRGCTIFSDDLALHNVALSRGYKSINFTEHRFQELLTFE